LKHNIKALKNLPKVILLLTLVTLSSCVSRVTIPEEEKPVFVVDLQMLRGSQAFATVHTSNNLNGSYPIERPENVKITVQEEGVDETSNFVWNDETRVYDFNGGDAFQNFLLTTNRKLELRVEILDSDIPEVESTSIVPNSGKLVDAELVFSETVNDENGNEFWQGTIRFNFQELNKNYPIYYQLMLNEKLQTKEVVDGEMKYTNLSNEKTPFEIVSVSSGVLAAKEFLISDGLWIDLDKLESEYFEVTIKSQHPIEFDNQTSDNIFSSVIGITKEHYDYHLGLNHIESSNSSLFGEPGLYRSNIENGLGIFSTCVKDDVTINLAK